MIELFAHNKSAYEAACEQLADTGKACIIHPTGTGKSFIAFKWVEDHPEKNILWLSPSRNIFLTQLENLKKVSGFEPRNLLFMTYARLINLTDEEIRSLQIDGIVFDEAHRAGAPVWQEGVERLLKVWSNAQLLGLTATPIRYLDKQRNIADELFDGCVVANMTLGEAIARGILPAPKYVMCLYTNAGDENFYEKEERKYRNRANRRSFAIRDQVEKYLDKLRRALEKAEGLDVVFERHLIKGKYIVFCANVEHMQEMEKKIPQWFSHVDTKPHIYSIWADSPNAEADYKLFMEDNSEHLRLLYCVDMFNEGIHLEDINGVILFRPTISPIIYKQQVGRALTAMKEGNPLIIDCVNNFENLYSISAIQEEMRTIIDFYRNERREDEIMADSFRIIDEVRDCRQIINRLEETLALSWEMMYKEAEKYYKEFGNLNVPKRYKTHDNIPLGVWILSQREIYYGARAGLLDENRIALLDAIGMNWSKINDAYWEKGLTHATLYKEKFGDLLVPAQYVCEDGFRLGSWISSQRVKYMKMRHACEDFTEIEHIKRLEAIGMVWVHVDAVFEEGMTEAIKYSAQHGNLDMPAKYVCANGFKLGQWVIRMRERYHRYRNATPLDEDQIRRLEALGIRWQGRFEQQWEKSFTEAERFYKENGHLAVPANYNPNGIRLDRWVHKQREAAKANRLSQEAIDRLASIGFSVTTRNKTWEDNFELAKTYSIEHGNLEVPPAYKAANGVWLGKWLSTQRLAQKKGELPAERFEQLSSIGMRWEDSNQEKWKSNLESVRAYPRRTDGVPIVPDNAKSGRGIDLKRWVEEVNRKYRRGELDPNQKSQWEQMLKEADLSCPS